MKEFSEKEYKQINLAIKKAENKTSAEIFAVLANKSDDYFYVAMFHFLIWMIFVSCVFGAYIFYTSFSVSLSLFLAGQLAAVVTGLILLKLVPKLAILLTPLRVKYNRAHLNCIKQFMAHGIHNTAGRSGVLIFVSLEERYGEVMVDGAIEEAMGQECWFEIVDVLIQACKNDKVSEGYIKAIEISGNKLSERFPRGRKRLNELEDKLVIL